MAHMRLGVPGLAMPARAAEPIRPTSSPSSQALIKPDAGRGRVGQDPLADRPVAGPPAGRRRRASRSCSGRWTATRSAVPETTASRAVRSPSPTPRSSGWPPRTSSPSPPTTGTSAAARTPRASSSATSPTRGRARARAARPARASTASPPTASCSPTRTPASDPDVMRETLRQGLRDWQQAARGPPQARRGQGRRTPARLDDRYAAHAAAGRADRQRLHPHPRPRRTASCCRGTLRDGRRRRGGPRPPLADRGRVAGAGPGRPEDGRPVPLPPAVAERIAALPPDRQHARRAADVAARGDPLAETDADGRGGHAGGGPAAAGRLGAAGHRRRRRRRPTAASTSACWATSTTTGRRRRIDRFDVVAVGDHWGEGPFTRGARPGRHAAGRRLRAGPRHARRPRAAAGGGMTGAITWAIEDARPGPGRASIPAPGRRRGGVTSKGCPASRPDRRHDPGRLGGATANCVSYVEPCQKSLPLLSVKNGVAGPDCGEQKKCARHLATH